MYIPAHFMLEFQYTVSFSLSRNGVRRIFEMAMGQHYPTFECLSPALKPGCCLLPLFRSQFWKRNSTNSPISNPQTRFRSDNIASQSLTAFRDPPMIARATSEEGWFQLVLRVQTQESPYRHPPLSYSHSPFPILTHRRRLATLKQVSPK